MNPIFIKSFAAFDFNHVSIIRLKLSLPICLEKTAPAAGMAPYFGLTGGWLTFWVSVACSTDVS